MHTGYTDCTIQEQALLKTVIRNDFIVLNLFIESGTDINIVDEHGRLPIAYVKEREQLQVLDLLLAAGSNIYKLDELGEMQFSTAFRSGHESVIRKYLEYHLNVNIADAKGQTAIHYLMDNCRHMEGILMNLNFNVNVEDRSCQTPMLLAIKNKNLNFINLLLKKGAHVNYEYERQSILYGVLRYIRDESIITAGYHSNTFYCMYLLIEKVTEVNRIFYGYSVLKLALKFFSSRVANTILRKLAIIEKSGSSILEINQETIEQYPKAKSYYSEVKAELEKMKELKLNTKVSCFDILIEEDISKLLNYFRSLKSCNDFRANIHKFHNYCEFLKHKFDVCFKMTSKMLEKEEMLSEIFYLDFPPHVIKKIAICFFSEEKPNFKYYM